MFKNIINAIKNKWVDMTKPQVMSEWWGPPEQNPFVTKTPTPTANPTPTPDVLGAITKGFNEWGGKAVPAATLAGTFKTAAEKNKIDPYLLPAVSILETGGGKKQSFNNNPINWGIYEESFKPKTPAETINKAASGIGTGRAFPYYEDYRQSKNVKDFASHYAPPNENDTTRYVNNLNKLMEMFRKYQ